MAEPHLTLVAVVLAVLLLGIADGLPQQLSADGAAAAGAGKGVFGSTYDEIVVETHLAVKPKVPSLSLRSGRARAKLGANAKPVFFRPNATSSASSRTGSGSGAGTSPVPVPVSVRPTEPGNTPPTTTSSDGISSAARVVGVENPLATARRLAQSSAQGR